MAMSSLACTCSIELDLIRRFFELLLPVSLGLSMTRGSAIVAFELYVVLEWREFDSRAQLSFDRQLVEFCETPVDQVARPRVTDDLMIIEIANEAIVGHLEQCAVDQTLLEVKNHPSTLLDPGSQLMSFQIDKLHRATKLGQHRLEWHTLALFDHCS